MIIDPRQSFKAGPHAKAWADVSASQVFLAAGQAALLQLQREFSLSQYTEQDITINAAASYWQLRGAQMLLDRMINLTEPDVEQKPNVTRSLNYKA